MILLLILFVLLTLYGGYSIITGVRKIRTPRPYSAALFTWTERPGLAFRYDFPSWLAINIHRGALVAIGAVGLLTLLRLPPGELNLGPIPDFASILVNPLLFVAVVLMGFCLGYSLFGPLAESIGGDHHYAISDDGLLIASQLLPWHTFSHFDPDASQNVIYVWSRSLPGTIATVLVPPSPGDLLKLSGILQNHLPASEPLAPGPIRRAVFPALMALACAPFLTVAVVLCWAPPALALLVDAVLIWALMALGGALIMRLIYGGKARPVPAT